ncbi:hypothetical protein BDV59DRAFT_26087 [Aspergillus ambiguus]|uniref:uncharacterized protein n=1 Tax=Aspergillus ambiguus TaxID=176160 RepID=UPI003CCD82A7
MKQGVSLVFEFRIEEVWASSGAGTPSSTACGRVRTTIYFDLHDDSRYPSKCDRSLGPQPRHYHHPLPLADRSMDDQLELSSPLLLLDPARPCDAKDITPLRNGSPPRNGLDQLLHSCIHSMHPTVRPCAILYHVQPSSPREPACAFHHVAT